MSDYAFYQIPDPTPAGVETALPKLLEKAYEAGFRVVVRCPSQERTKRLNEALWTYKEDSFLPHGVAEDGAPSLQPIYLTEHEENANNANVLVFISGAGGQNVEAEKFSAYSKVLDIFEGSDVQKQKARARWKALKEQGITPIYYAYENGAWVKRG